MLLNTLEVAFQEKNSSLMQIFKTDARIDKIIKDKKNSCMMITGEMICDIQDINFISTLASNIETSTNISSGRITAQSMANSSQENANQNQKYLNNTDDDDENPDDVEENSNNIMQNNCGKRKRKSRK
ncbi:17883_t:CDS:1 [Funneliformis caledonium]|uniref:17883_t:CDS:1 n=1 Tax=Funneliformis caledonium TaxID=1117310 RepID=A0A9N9CWR3_9GLOM|nr:17883_t:CDS:1 [Funneliformis caledonium]